MIRPSIATVALAFALGDCRMCKKDPPVILFPGAEGGATVESDASPMPSHDGAMAGDAGSAIPRIDARRAEGNGRSIVVEGVTVNAPDGAQFREFLAQDVDGDGDNDLVASITRANANAAIVFFTRDEASYVSAPANNLEAPTRSCVPAGLAAFTPKTWTVRFEQCAGATGGSDSGVDPSTISPNTVLVEHVAIAVDAAGASGRLRVAELGPWLPHTQLSISLGYIDRDGDGRADVSVELHAARAQDPTDAPRAKATLVLLDRGVGFARDTTEPSASIAQLVSQTRANAFRANRAEDALAMVERAARLRRALCVEAGAPRVRIGGEVGVRCASSFNAFSEVVARALVSAGEFAAAEATQWPDSAQEFGVLANERIDQDLQRGAGSETGVGARSGPFVGSTVDDTWIMRRSALALDPPVTPTSVSVLGPVHAQLTLDTFTNTSTGEGALSELALKSPDGARVAVGAWQTCDGVMLAICATSDSNCASAPIGSSPPQGAALERIAELPSPEFGARCLRREASSEPLRRPNELRAIGWGTDGLLLSYRGRILRGLTAARATFAPLGRAAPGAGFAAGQGAVSADGRVIAVQGADAIYVRDATGRWKGWRPPQLAGRTRQLSDLTVSADGRTIVGRVGTQLWVIERR
ncbi:MAG: hypothetical protein JNK05_16600 [Myxococcales bacterium]|nr:hypothetical protein [Myxococcales bacterium]